MDIFEACKDGNLAEVHKLLEAEGFDINATGDEYLTPLWIAAQEGHAEVVKVLIEAKADLNKANNNGATPLYVAAARGHANVITVLLSANANPDKATTNNGATPLFIAAARGHADVVNVLLRANANPDKAKTGVATLLFIASMHGRLSVVDLLADTLLRDSTAKSFSYSEFRLLCRQYKLLHDAGRNPEATANLAEAIKRIIHNPDLASNAIPIKTDVRQALLDIYPQGTRIDLLTSEIKKPRPNASLASFLLANMSKEEQEYFSKNLFPEKQKIMLSEIAKSEPNIALVEFLLKTMSQEGREIFHQGQKFYADVTDGEYHGTTPIIDAANNLGPKTDDLMAVLITHGASIDVHEAVKKSPFTYLVHRAWSIFETEAEKIRLGSGMDTTADGSNASGGGSAAEDASSHASTESEITKLRDEIEKMLRPALNCLLYISFNGAPNGHKLSAVEIINGAPKSSAVELREFFKKTGINLLDLKGVEAELRFHDLEQENTALKDEVATLRSKGEDRDQRLERLEAKVAELTAAMRKPRPTEQEYDVPNSKSNSEVVGNTTTSSEKSGKKRKAPKSPEPNDRKKRQDSIDPVFAHPTATADTSSSSSATRSDRATGSATTSPATTPTSPTTGSKSASSTAQSL